MSVFLPVYAFVYMCVLVFLPVKLVSGTHVLNWINKLPTGLSVSLSAASVIIYKGDKADGERKRKTKVLK